MDNISDTEKAYLAGLFDNIGSIGIYKRSRNKNNTYYLADVSITSNYDKEYVQMLKNTYKIGIIIMNGKLPVWKITGKDVDVFISIIEEFSWKKLSQLSIVKKFRKTYTSEWQKDHKRLLDKQTSLVDKYIDDSSSKKKKRKRGRQPVSPIIVEERKRLMVLLKDVKDNVSNG